MVVVTERKEMNKGKNDSNLMNRSSNSRENMSDTKQRSKKLPQSIKTVTSPDRQSLRLDLQVLSPGKKTMSVMTP